MFRMLNRNNRSWRVVNFLADNSYVLIVGDFAWIEVIWNDRLLFIFIP